MCVDATFNTVDFKRFSRTIHINQYRIKISTQVQKKGVL